MASRLEHVAERAIAPTIALAAVAALVGGCGSSNNGGTSSTATKTSSASSLAPVHGRYSPSIDPANFVATIDNRYFPLEAGHGLPLQGRQRNDAADRRHGRDRIRTKRILGVTMHGRAGHGVRAREADRADLRLVRAGQAGQRLVHGRGLASSCKHGRFVKASDSWESGVNGAQARNHHARQPAAGRCLPAGVLPARQALDQAHVLGPTRA